MCFTPKSNQAPPAAQALALPDSSGEATRQASVQAMIRRAKLGPAADILTSPLGIPAGTEPLGVLQ